jgi:hypothetical protein
MPTPQHHLQNALDHLPTTLAVVSAGTASSVAVLTTNLDLAAKVVAITVGVLNGAWVCRQMWLSFRAKQR